MDGDAGFREMLRQVQEGSPQAVQALLDKYTPIVRKAVRQRLNRRVRSEFDSSDFTQWVWLEFFGRRQAISSFESPRQLACFLLRVARNRVIDKCRQRLLRSAQEIPRGSSIAKMAFDPEPRPSEVVRAKDTLSRMLDEPPDVQKLVQMRAAGATYLDIARILGVDPKTVQRYFRRLERRLA